MRKPRFDVFISLKEEDDRLARKAKEKVKTWRNVFMEGVKKVLGER